MEILIGLFVFLVLGGAEAGLLCSLANGGWFALAPLFVFVVPALLAGVDLWHVVSRRFWPANVARSELASLIRFISCWVFVSLSPMVALMVLFWHSPQLYPGIHSYFDCWRLAMSICIVHGLFSLSAIEHGGCALSIGYFASRMRRSPVSRSA